MLRRLLPTRASAIAASALTASAFTFSALKASVLTGAVLLCFGAAASAEPTIKQVFSGQTTLNDTPIRYPEGKPELRLIRVELPPGGKIPLHTHPAPMLVYVQAERSGDLLNTRVQPDGSKLSSVFKPGEAFIEGASEPHFVENTGDTPTIVWVMVASAEGLPTTEWVK
ncbi:MAG: cupin domain-containing protein [Cyanobacteriota bacterium]|nr:cupin domain-containing protein [Cyanobacteriota bacterium]